MAQLDRVAIVGLGLIGGSLGLALRRHRLAREVLGYSRRPATLRRAKARGAIDRGTGRLAGIACADLVILATPVDRIVPLGRALLPHMRRGTVLTDVGSSKSMVTAGLERACARRGVAFVGGHPLAGSEQRGMAAADGALFARATIILTPTPRTDRHALRRVSALWRSVGCRIVRMPPERHDRLLADFSHLPHALACTLMGTIAPARDLPALRSFLDMTRIAKSDPDLWDDILVSNRAELLRAMAQFERTWRRLRGLIARGDRAGLRRALSTAKRRRDALDRP